MSTARAWFARLGPMRLAQEDESRFRVELVCIPIVATAYAAHLFLRGYKTFYYDSYLYWQLGHSFEHNGHFSLVAFNPAGYPRGYSLPLLNHFLQVIASAAGIGGVTMVKLFGVLLATTLGVVVAPRLARQLFPNASIGVGRVLALNGLLFLFWRDHFDFPLSDFPSLLAASVALLGLLRASAPGYVVAGLGFGLAANMRPSYQPALLGALLVAALLPIRRWDWRLRSTSTALVLSGALIAFLPQMVINHHARGSWSPSVPGGKEISLLQLSDGMTAQKYETYVGSSAGYPQPQVFYLDPATADVLARHHIQSAPVFFGQRPPIASYGQYARIVMHDPAEAAASYMRHIFNGLDVRYPTPYVRNLGNTSILLSLLQYTLMFLLFARLLLPETRRALGRVRWAGVIILASPCLTAIPGPVEPRFFLPLQLLIYMFACFGPGTRVFLLGDGSQRRIALGLSYTAFILVCLTLSSETLSHLQYPGPTLGMGGAPSRTTPAPS